MEKGKRFRLTKKINVARPGELNMWLDEGEEFYVNDLGNATFPMGNYDIIVLYCLPDDCYEEIKSNPLDEMLERYKVCNEWNGDYKRLKSDIIKLMRDLVHNAESEGYRMVFDRLYKEIDKLEK